jgi:drug/metabolite transporter (DMT)-like permease
MGLTGIFYYGSLQSLPASLAIILLFQFTWIGVLLDAFLERRKPGPDKLLALIPLIAGTFLAGGITNGGLSGLNPTGLLLGFLSAISYSLFILFSGRVAVQVPPLKRSTLMTFGSAALTLTVFPPSFLWNGALLHGLLLWGILLAIFGAVLPTICYTIGVPHIGGALATILSAAELPVAVIASGWVLSEAVSAVQWVGVSIILAGIALPEILRFLKQPRPAVEGPGKE